MLEYLKDYFTDIITIACLFLPLAILGGLVFLVLWLVQQLRKKNEAAGNATAIILAIIVGALILLAPLIILFVVLKDMP